MNLDERLNELRDYLNDELFKRVSKRQFLGRVFSNKREEGNIAESYQNGKNYKDEMFDSRLNVNSWMLPIGTGKQNLGATEQDVLIFFAINLNAVYPDITTTRAIGKCESEMLSIIGDYEDTSFKMNELLSGLDAYNDLAIDKVKDADIQPFHVVSVKSTFYYTISKC